MRKLKLNEYENIYKHTYENNKHRYLVYDCPPTSLIYEAFRSKSFTYLAILGKPSYPIEANNKFYAWEISEAFYTEDFMALEMNKLLNKISYWLAKIKSTPNEHFYIKIYTMIKDKEDHFVYQDVTDKMIKLSEENDLYEVSKSFVNNNKYRSQYT